VENNPTSLHFSDFRARTWVELLRWRARRSPDRRLYSFLRFERGETIDLTCGELDRRARAVAAELQRHGRVGTRAVLLYHPGPEFVEAFFGCLYGGVIAVPVKLPFPDRSMREFAVISRHVKAALVLTTSKLRPDLEELLATVPGLGSAKWLETDLAEATEPWSEPALSGAQVALIQYPPDSADADRGVSLCHANLLYNAALIHACFAPPSTTRSVNWLPPFYDMGLVGGILQPLYSGFRAILMSHLDFFRRPIRWLETISKARATVSGGPCLAFELCAATIEPEQQRELDLSCWDVALVGGEPLRLDVLERFATAFEPCGFRREAFFPCHHFSQKIRIGQIEPGASSPAASFTVTADPERKPAAPPRPGAFDFVGCGAAPTTRDLAIVDPRTLRRCRTDEVGEIWLRGPGAAESFWHSRSRNERTWGAYTSDTGEGPFLRTADLGFIRDGELFLTGHISNAG
jgi:acyl-CoA synthetase (AMP-forming)/AMP-acid ligase II